MTIDDTMPAIGCPTTQRRTWLDLHRALRAAGWRHTRAWYPGQADLVGSPIGDGWYEHTWRRGDASAVCVHTDWQGEPDGWINHSHDAASDQWASIHIGHLRRLGPDRAADLMVTLGILPAASINIEAVTHPTPVGSTTTVLGEVAAERTRQDATWGPQNHPDGTGLWVHDLTAAGLAREACQKAAAAGEVTWRHILAEETTEAFAERAPAQLRAELVQVAAVAVAWIEAIDRRAAKASLRAMPTDPHQPKD